MKIDLKYGIGDAAFYVSWFNNRGTVEYDEIASIKISNGNPEYTINNLHTFTQDCLYDTFEDARKACLKRQKSEDSDYEKRIVEWLPLDKIGSRTY